MKIRSKEADHLAAEMTRVLREAGFVSIGERGWQETWGRAPMQVVLTNLEASRSRRPGRLIEAEVYDPGRTPDVRLVYSAERLAGLLGER